MILPPLILQPNRQTSTKLIHKTYNNTQYISNIHLNKRRRYILVIHLQEGDIDVGAEQNDEAVGGAEGEDFLG